MMHCGICWLGFACTVNPKPVRLTGNSLYVHSHKEKPFFISGNPFLLAGILFSLQGFPSKPLYFPVGDCSALNEWTAKGVSTDPYDFSMVASKLVTIVFR